MKTIRPIAWRRWHAITLTPFNSTIGCIGIKSFCRRRASSSIRSGRKLSLDIVQRKIQLAQQLGIRAGLRGLIYAANPFFAEHCEEGALPGRRPTFMLGDF